THKGQELRYADKNAIAIIIIAAAGSAAGAANPGEAVRYIHGANPATESVWAARRGGLTHHTWLAAYIDNPVDRHIALSENVYGCIGCVALEFDCYEGTDRHGSEVKHVVRRVAQRHRHRAARRHRAIPLHLRAGRYLARRIKRSIGTGAAAIEGLTVR